MNLCAWLRSFLQCLLSLSKYNCAKCQLKFVLGVMEVHTNMCACMFVKLLHLLFTVSRGMDWLVMHGNYTSRCVS